MKNRRLIILMLLTAGCAVAIFMLSAQEKAVSSASSLGVMRAIAKFLSGTFGVEISNAQIISLHNVFRKTAHFTAYMVLAVLSFSSLRLIFRRMRNAAAAAMIFCVVMAVSDEIHQTFVPGRSGEVRDVIIDSTGALTGVLIVCGADIIFRIIGRRRAAKARL